ncbi:MAG TPA: DUF1566 domain-containing protein [Myxococcales bacterium]
MSLHRVTAGLALMCLQAACAGGPGDRPDGAAGAEDARPAPDAATVPGRDAGIADAEPGLDAASADAGSDRVDADRADADPSDATAMQDGAALDAASSDSGLDPGRPDASEPADSGGAVDAGPAPPDAGESDGGAVATWFDPSTGLEWMQTNSSGDLDWQGAGQYCADSGGGWRLPTIDELRGTVRGCPESEPGGACAVSTSCTAPSCNAGCGCAGASPSGCYRLAEFWGACEWFWSSTAADEGGSAWSLNFWSASFDATDVGYALNFRCVR